MRQSSTASKWRIDSWVVIALAALIAVLFYLITSELIFRIGFPLLKNKSVDFFRPVQARLCCQ